MALLEGVELAELAGLLHGVVGEDPKKRLELLLSKEVFASLPPLGTPDGSDGPFIEWLAACDRTGLLKVLALIKRNPSVKVVIERLEQAMPSPSPPLPVPAEANGVDPNWHLLGRNRVVLGRPRLREKFRELVEGKRRVALVRGDRWTGKTFTHDILRDKARRLRPEIETIYVDVMRANTVRKIAEQAVLLMGGTSSIPEVDTGPGERSSTQSWWVDRVADWIAVEARRDSAIQYWLVLDGYERVPQEPDITQLLSGLAVRAVQRMDDENGFRVIFVDHPDLLPPDTLDFHIKEVIDPIKEFDVFTMLRKVFSQKSDDDLSAIAKDLVSNTQPDSYLAHLQEQLSKLVFKDR